MTILSSAEWFSNRNSNSLEIVGINNLNKNTWNGSQHENISGNTMQYTEKINKSLIIIKHSEWINLHDTDEDKSSTAQHAQKLALKAFNSEQAIHALLQYSSIGRCQMMKGLETK
jgi:hypothetical protein